jgi:hypothetical protein
MEPEAVPAPAGRQRIYQCCCLITWTNGKPGEMTCNVPVGPDEPFCGPCSDRHPELRDEPGTFVTQRMPEAAGGG